MRMALGCTKWGINQSLLSPGFDRKTHLAFAGMTNGEGSHEPFAKCMAFAENARSANFPCGRKNLRRWFDANTKVVGSLRSFVDNNPLFYQGLQ